MKNPVYAKAVSEPYRFGDSARWIRPTDVQNFSNQMFRKSFRLEKLPEKAVMLAMAANYAEIYINGAAAMSLAVRSYIFDKAYEVADILPYLREGKNVIAVMNTDTGEEIRAGFALEIQADRETLCFTDGSWVYKKEEALKTPVNHLISGGGEETVDAEKLVLDFAEIDFDDSDWENAHVIGDELLHAPYGSFHQSITKAQTADVHYAKNISALMLAQTPMGYPMRLASSNNGMTVAMTHMITEEDTELTFVIRDGIRAVYIDGQEIAFNQSFHLREGVHFCAIAYAWTPDFLIRTKSPLTLTSPLANASPFEAYLIPTPPVRYPWNEYKGKNPTDDVMQEILKYPSFVSVPDDIKEKLTPMDYTVPTSAFFGITTRDYLIPVGGYAEERILENCRIAPADDIANIKNEKSILAENAEVVISPQKEMLNFILDFGDEQVGNIAFELDAPKGTVVEIHSFEMITDAGIKYMKEVTTIRYLCREGLQSYISRRQRGFRYLSVTVYNHTRDVVLKDIHVIETRYPMKNADFSCSDERLNQIYRMSIRTAEVCSLDLYTDCPGYEQNPWTGDARTTANVNLLNFGEFAFDEQYLKLIANSIEDGLWLLYRKRNPRYINRLYLPCACFPTYPEGCIPVWSFMWLLQVWDHYEITGDKQCLSDLFGAVTETLNRCERMTDERGLFDMQGAWNLIEWANNDLDFYGEVTANNAMLSYCFAKAADMANVLGKPDIAAHNREMSAKYRDAVNTYCWDETKKAYVDTVRDEWAYERYLAYMDERNMAKISYEDYLKRARISVQTNTMALLYDCVPEERKADAMRFLIDNIESGIYVSGTPANRTTATPSEEEAPDGYVHIGSPFFLYFALQTLYKFARDDLAILSQKRDWGNLLESGLTTCIETFKSGRDWTRSVAHAWSASPAIFFMSEILGIKPVKPGYAEFKVEPKPSGLSFAKGSVPTPYGRIYVEWKKNEDGMLDIFCNAPKECKKVF
ncbi:MAG: family 78 glycoside hydrolase catalytic domain [Clostridia bacterium]|nr:family 78 glycoside hydrolase catalytic domain [Clostridia bacterium]